MLNASVICQPGFGGYNCGRIKTDLRGNKQTIQFVYDDDILCLKHYCSLVFQGDRRIVFCGSGRADTLVHTLYVCQVYI